MRIAHVASEAVPIAKTGGLADVVGALAKALGHMGHRVFIVMPLYRQTMNGPIDAEPVMPDIDAGEIRFRIYRKHIGPVDYVLLDAPRLFARPAPYGTSDGDYPDNPIRFAAFARAAILAISTVIGGADVIHCHDWQSALVPLLLGRDPLLGGAMTGTPTILTIHNLSYQGSFEPWAIDAARLPRELFTPEGFELYGTVNYLKGGILTASRLTTVSPRYAREILTPDFGYGLEKVLEARRNRLSGILNGLDTGVWNPSTDPYLARNYSRRDVTRGKRACRAALAAELLLDDDDSPLVAIVSRMAEQKGIDLVAAAIDGIVASGLRIAILGAGDDAVQNEVLEACHRRPGRAAVRIGYDEAHAHRSYAGADLLLMPSRFEPCGLGQMIALRYGTLPVVNAVGGLADTVRDLDTDPTGGNGFRIAQLTPEGISAALRRAAKTVRNPSRLLDARRRAMAENHDWKRPARTYEALYTELLA
ncbi:MAG: glycogen synthase GlgA [Acidobacteria bacterium]|nr:glycogen synthase GlgA [Acidobacteriota bacterium]